MNTLTKSMALDYAKYRIRVNAVCPAGTWTPMLRQWCSEQPDHGSTERYLEEIHPLGYCPDGDAIADVCVFLLSARARFITGHIMHISGGRNWAIVGCLKSMIQSFSTRDARFPIGHGHGSDAIHKDPVYSYAVTELHDHQGRTGAGLAFTLGEGNQLVCEAAAFYAR